MFEYHLLAHLGDRQQIRESLELQPENTFMQWA